MSESEGFDLVVVPRDGGETRTIRVGPRRRRLLLVGGSTFGVLLLFLAGSWAFVARTAARVPQLTATIDSLEAEREQILELAGQLEALEAQYGQVRDLFGARPTAPSDLWLPPSGGRSAVRASDPAASTPESWPLSEPGFVTRALLEGADEDHPGLDIAVPVGTWVRAAGAGVVVDVGEDPVYGHFVTLDHGEGLVTLYGHAERTFVARGQQVRRNEVIALSGNSGRSTAPHLHFEVRRDGVALDPTTFVDPAN